MLRSHTLGLLILGALGVAPPASAQWTQVADIPATRFFSVSASGDTIAAGADTAVYVSTSAGATWMRSTKPVSGVNSIQALWIRAGRIYAGTFGQGVHVSDDLGTTWLPFNDGLVGGILNSQLDVVDLQARDDSLYAATAGAGVYVRSFAGSAWQPSGSALEPNQASNVNGLALGGSRLIASAGSNGQVFLNDPGDADWTISNLDNVGLHPGLQAKSAAWTGTGWVVGTDLGVFRSVAGQEPWTPVGLGLGVLNWTAFAPHQGHLFAAFDIPAPPAAVIEESDDDGATWQNAEAQPGVFVQEMAISGDNLYAARADGLWRRPVSATTAIAVALEDAQADAGVVRLRWVVPDARGAVCTVFRRTAASDWVELGPGSVESSTRVVYEDHTATPGDRYAYKLLVRTASDQGYSNEVWVSVPREANAPLALRLDPVYPNPFEARTNLNFAVPRGGSVRLAIYTAAGRMVATVFDQTLPPGWRSVAWDGRDASGRPVASGTYFAKLESAGKAEVRKVVVAR